MSEFSAFSSRLLEDVQAIGTLSTAQVEQCWRHFDLMRRWNRKMNLTAILDPVEAARRHYAESMWLGSLLPPDLGRIADIGSGAGFPGFPLAVQFPERSITAVEVDQRKAAFLRESSDFVSNLRVRCELAEHLAGEYDAFVNRAVSMVFLERLFPTICPVLGVLVSSQDADGIQSQFGEAVLQRRELPWREGGAAIVLRRIDS